jgi:sulfate transport system substrate-binding protein
VHASYDATRALYHDINQAFVARMAAQGERVRVVMSHGGSGKQARAVLDGLPADVLSAAVARDTELLAEAGLLDDDQRAVSPFPSTVVFVVRAGNPRGIVDWHDLSRPDVVVVLPSPQTSGGARLVHLAAWAAARGGAPLDDAAADARAERALSALYARVPVFDAGARGSATTFVERGVGDVLVAWESEAALVVARAPDRFSTVTPPTTVWAEPPVVVVDAHVERRGTRALAEAYVAFLRGPEAQAIGRRHHFRGAFDAPTAPTVEAIAGDWQRAQRRHFDAGGVFDRAVSRR